VTEVAHTHLAALLRRRAEYARHCDDDARRSYSDWKPAYERRAQYDRLGGEWTRISIAWFRTFSRRLPSP
jgi:hypothetical protein